MSENAVMVIENPYELSVAEVKRQVEKVHVLMRDLMQEGTHYGKSFPGDEKKNLLKPGADKLMFMFRLRPDFTQEIKELPNGHREVITHCQVFHIESGNKIAEGVGSASTMESKYRWRNAGRKCPKCGKETIIAGKKEYGGGWICYAKKGGCGVKFDENDPSITGQQIGKIENPDIADCYNTVLKISKKRAYVDATITATAASDIFTQDLDDLEPNGIDEPNGNSRENLRNVTPDHHENEPENKPTKKPENEPNDQQSLITAIKSILFTLNPDERLYFPENEIETEKVRVADAKNLQMLKDQYERLKNELAKKVAEYKPIPFDDTAADEFKDEIPWDNTKSNTAESGEIDIF